MRKISQMKIIQLFKIFLVLSTVFIKFIYLLGGNVAGCQIAFFVYDGKIKF